MHSINTISLASGLHSKAGQAWQALAPALSGAYHRWLHARQANATARTLNLLDARLLHDLGLDRSELLSAAAELHGQASRERRQALPGTPQPR
ncbi:MAG TPA: DUF1127 domain-containing protein [Ideonella sp.]|nr:DUF1127 domain-containing protein [Ideonella sp.]